MFVVVFVALPVSTLVTVTDAFGTAAPVVSVTRPTIEPVVVWAIADSTVSARPKAIQKNRSRSVLIAALLGIISSIVPQYAPVFKYYLPVGNACRECGLKTRKIIGSVADGSQRTL